MTHPEQHESLQSSPNIVNLQSERVGDSSPEEFAETRDSNAYAEVGTEESEEAVEVYAHAEQDFPTTVEDGNVNMCETGVAELFPDAADSSTPTQQQSTLLNDTILLLVVELENNEVRKSKRASKEPLWLHDYVTTKKGQGSSYPMSNYLSYARLTGKYRSFMVGFPH